MLRWQATPAYPQPKSPTAYPIVPPASNYAPQAGPNTRVKITPIKKFTPSDEVLSASLTRHDGAWSATLKTPETLRLFEISDPKAEDCRVFYRAKLRTQEFKGQVYLEMWCRIPGKGEFYSRGMDNALTGSTGWVSCETPFSLEVGQRPDLIRLNVVAQGTGVVMIKDVELFLSKEVRMPTPGANLPPQANGFAPTPSPYLPPQMNGMAPVANPANPFGTTKPKPAPPGPADQPSMQPLYDALRPEEQKAKAELEIAEARLAQAKATGAMRVDESNSLVAAAEATYRAAVGGDAARRIQSQNNMRQIALAVLNYESSFNHLPPAYIADKTTGKPLLSWRVAILPFIEQDALYQKFHLDEPWDSEHNRKLLDSKVAVYRSPASRTKPGMTNYLSVRGKDTAFPGNEGIKIMDILDGTSNTIMVVEADDSKAVPWTKPDDLEYDEKNPATGLGGLFKGGFNAVLCDGSAHFLPSSIEADSLRRLFKRNDGEPVDWNQINRRPQTR
jgi:hypothetical protein